MHPWYHIGSEPTVLAAARTTIALAVARTTGGELNPLAPSTWDSTNPIELSLPAGPA